MQYTISEPQRALCAQWIRFIGSRPVYSLAPLITNGSGSTKRRTGISPMNASPDISPGSRSAGVGSILSCCPSFITRAERTSPNRSLTVTDTSSMVNIPRFSAFMRQVRRHFWRLRRVNIPEIRPFCVSSRALESRLPRNVSHREQLISVRTHGSGSSFALSISSISSSSSPS